jgi:hypothetical protein
LWIDARRPGRVHVRDHGCHAESGVKKGEEWKGRKIDLSGLDAVGVPDSVHLGHKVRVAVDHPFWRAGTARGEDDGRHVIGSGIRHGLSVRIRTQLFDLVKRSASPKEAPPDGDFPSNRRPCPSEEDTCGMGF